jgi:IMP dehydrogenase
MGGLAILHRFMSPLDQVEILEELRNFWGVAVSVGVNLRKVAPDVKQLFDVGARIFCVDVAHGDHELAIMTVKWLRDFNKDLFIIAGNVATGFGARRLFEAGADAVKVGVGPGSLCTTRIETGNGVPQLTALMDVNEIRNGLYPNRQIIADGGIRSAGDCVKALCFADFVMCGSLFAGCPEAPGEIFEIEGKKYKKYVGSSTHKANHIEGVEALVECKEPFVTVLRKLLGGIASGLSYQGAHSLEGLHESPPEFVKITSAGWRESLPHIKS